MLGVDLNTFIQMIGLIGLFAVVFAESGLLVGFFLPGDSLLFTAGFLASQGYFYAPFLMAGCFIAAVLGDNAGYAFGRRAGPVIFRREDSWIFRKSHLERARSFYDKYGGKAVVLARFMPVIRTFAPILAGVGNMNYRMFFFYNVIGGFLWAIGMTGVGYFLGSAIPGIEHYISYVIVAIIIASFMPPVIHILREKEHRDEIRRIVSIIVNKLFGTKSLK